MWDAGGHYEYITVYSDELIVFRKYPTFISRGLNTILPLKIVGETYLYLSDVVTEEINGEVTHDFSACTYIKTLSDNIEKIFDITLNNYLSKLEGDYNTEVDTSYLLVEAEVSR